MSIFPKMSNLYYKKVTNFYPNVNKKVASSSNFQNTRWEHDIIPKLIDKYFNTGTNSRWTTVSTDVWQNNLNSKGPSLFWAFSHISCYASSSWIEVAQVSSCDQLKLRNIRKSSEKVVKLTIELILFATYIVSKFKNALPWLCVILFFISVYKCTLCGQNKWRIGALRSYHTFKLPVFS